MIVILDIEPESSENLNEYISKLGHACVVSKREKDICSSTHLIIPPLKNVHSVIKKIHLFNLYSILRMVKKPVLGIGTGLLIMNETLPGGNEAGLGYFNIYSGELRTAEWDNDTSSKIQWIQPCPLFAGDRTYETVEFSEAHVYLIENTKYTSAVFAAHPDYSVCWRNENHFGILFSPILSKMAGERIINSFANIT